MDRARDANGAGPELSKDNRTPPLNWHHHLTNNYYLALNATKSCKNNFCSFLSVIMGSLHLMKTSSFFK